MRWLKISYVLSRAGRPILLSATLLGACAGGSKAKDASAIGATDGPRGRGLLADDLPPPSV
jgi:hypothetical protein